MSDLEQVHNKYRSYNIDLITKIIDDNPLLSESTINNYYKALLHYTCFFYEDLEELKEKRNNAKTVKQQEEIKKDLNKLFNTYLNELYQEALEDKQKRLFDEETRLYDRLKEYNTYLLRTDFKQSSINEYMSKIRAFYNKMGIRVPPKYRTPEKPDTTKRTFDEIPTKDHIRQAVNSTHNKKYKAIILFMASSGTATKEASEITIENFLKGTEEYHKTKINNENAYAILEQLNERNNRDYDIIPYFKMYRSKNKNDYYTLCTPEATKYILDWLLTEYENKPIDINNKLFSLRPKSFNSFFTRINKKCDFGKVKGQDFLKPHILRAVQMNQDLTDQNYFYFSILQGRKGTVIQETYYKAGTNYKKLKEIYIKVVPLLTFMEETPIKPQYNEKYEELKREYEKLESLYTSSLREKDELNFTNKVLTRNNIELERIKNDLIRKGDELKESETILKESEAQLYNDMVYYQEIIEQILNMFYDKEIEERPFGLKTVNYRIKSEYNELEKELNKVLGLN